MRKYCLYPGLHDLNDPGHDKQTDMILKDDLFGYLNEFFQTNNLREGLKKGLDK